MQQHFLLKKVSRQVAFITYEGQLVLICHARMNLTSKYKFPSWLPRLNSQVWFLWLGRFLCEMGNGFTLFYGSIFFVNQVGLSATQVGVAVSCASISGIVGRILGGSFSDSEFWGRRRTLLLCAAIVAIASVVLATTSNFSTLVDGNLLMGLGQGLYGPAMGSLLADVARDDRRRETYALTRIVENLGSAMGIVGGGALIAATGAYRALFVISAVSFVIFFAVVYLAIPETYRPQQTCRGTSLQGKWATALRDRRLLVYVLVNILFTTYFSELFVTLPLYLKNFVLLGHDLQGFGEATISVLFGWHMTLAILCQLPFAHILKRCTDPQALIISALMWSLGFVCVWFTGITSAYQLGWAMLGLALFALGAVCYIPSAAALVTDLAKESQRGVYFSINSLCWAAGYFIGPPLGGWALDQPQAVADNFWLGLALSVVVTVVILHYLERMLRSLPASCNQK